LPASIRDLFLIGTEKVFQKPGGRKQQRREEKGTHSKMEILNFVLLLICVAAKDVLGDSDIGA